MYDVGKSIEQVLSIERFNKRNVNLFIKRDDLIDNDVSGNKWRKLKYNIEHVVQNNLKGILTFGGAFSNHIAATAFAFESEVNDTIMEKELEIINDLFIDDI